jgi:DNA-binding protein HU-alpha
VAAADADLAEKGTTVRKKDLIERVAAASGAKKKVVKDIVEATLRVLGDALAADETLALPPFGKAKVNKHRGMAKGEMLVVKLRRSGADADARKARAKASNDALAETGE